MILIQLSLYTAAMTAQAAHRHDADREQRQIFIYLALLYHSFTRDPSMLS